jgi:hypothetical protein
LARRPSRPLPFEPEYPPVSLAHHDHDLAFAGRDLLSVEPIGFMQTQKECPWIE